MFRRVLPGLLLAILTACDQGSSPAPSPTALPRDDRPNVLLITLDTTRADRLGCYGYDPARTPHLDGLAESGVRFQRAACQAPLTLPSHASILTSLYPPSHGLRINSQAALPEDLPVLPALLQEQGYRTGAFVASWVLKSSFGLDRGFQRYDQTGLTAGQQQRPVERSGGEVCDAALAWLRESPDRPFFAWVHFFDPHTPYDPPEEFQTAGDDPYDGEIAFMDFQVGRLLGWLEESGLADRTLVVAAGDHGEAFDEHDEVEHGLFLYQPTMRVPLLLRWPGRLPTEQVIQARVGLVDLAPTILELLGQEPATGWQGRSLVALIEGRDEPERPGYGESLYSQEVFGWAPLKSWSSDHWKYIQAPRPELYDLRADPGEAENRVEDEPEMARRLRTELEAFERRHPDRMVATVELSPEEQEALESLGYLGTSSDPAPAGSPTDRPDPKEMTSIYRGIKQAMTLDGQRRYPEVIQVLEPLLSEDESSPQILTLLGEAYLHLWRAPEAEEIYRRSLALSPDDPGKVNGLASARLQQGHVEEAQGLFQRVLELDPASDQAHSGLGSIQIQLGQVESALATFRRGLELDPDSTSLMVNIGALLNDQNRHREATVYLEGALKLDRHLPVAHQALWWAWFALGDRPRARQALTTAVETYPRNQEFHRHLIGLLANTPEFGAPGRRESLRRAEELCRTRGESPENLELLALACSANGQTARAGDLLKQAISQALEQGNDDLAARLSASFRTLRQGR